MLPFIETIYAQILLMLIPLTTISWLITRLAFYLHDKSSNQKSMIDQINRLLPQTQCGQCGHAGCRPYAKAISQGEAINKCPPGGSQTIIRLANLLNEAHQPLDPAHGENQPFAIAVIREDECIGCTKCIQACPVDAILGAQKLMHTVIEIECTGCDLCVEPCPVDCIDMIVTSKDTRWTWPLPSHVATPRGLMESVL